MPNSIWDVMVRRWEDSIFMWSNYWWFFLVLAAFYVAILIWGPHVD